MHTVVFKNYETSEKQAKLIIFIILKSRDWGWLNPGISGLQSLVVVVHIDGESNHSNEINMIRCAVTFAIAQLSCYFLVCKWEQKVEGMAVRAKIRTESTDACNLKWTSRTVNRMRLMLRRRDLIPQVRWCISKSWMVCNEEDTDGRARVTTVEERVLHVDWTKINSCR